jgi:hypothetical protein
VQEREEFLQRPEFLQGPGIQGSDPERLRRGQGTGEQITAFSGSGWPREGESPLSALAVETRHEDPWIWTGARHRLAGGSSGVGGITTLFRSLDSIEAELLALLFNVSF